MKKYRSLLIFIIFSIFFFLIIYFGKTKVDLVWNYGFCYNYANNLKMYSDYNMVITPLYPFLFGNIMKLLGNNFIIFMIINSFIPAGIITIIDKFYHKLYFEIVIMLTYVCEPNYNLLGLLLLFILLIMEDKKKNDYLIGIFLGLAFLTKSSLGLLCLSSLYYYKDIKKVLKRAIGFLIPNILFIIYFLINNSLKDYLNYAFGSLFDFASKNIIYSWSMIIFIISILFIIYKYIKNKDIKLLYILSFQIISYPLFNLIHLTYSFIPLLFYILYSLKSEYYFKINKIVSIIALSLIIGITIFYDCSLKMVYGTNALSGKLIEQKYMYDINLIEDNVSGLDNTYFVMYEAYYNKLLLNIKINKYDLLLMGNIGYNGEKNIIKKFTSLPNGTQILMYKDYEGAQASETIYNYVKNNYSFYKSFDRYILYIKN